jgi:glycosyltransferase involved in cell wall biosynthesis
VGAAGSKVKILYHHRTSAQDGSAVHIEGLIDALRAQGAEVVVVAPPVASAAPAGARVSRLAKLRRSLPRVVHEALELLYNIPESIRLARAIRKHRPDVIYERSNVFLIAGAALAARSGVPRITEVNAPYFLERSRHGGVAMEAVARWTEEAAWRRANAVITVTSELARIVERSGVPRERLHVMSNGIDADAFRPSAIDAGAKERLGWSNRTVLGFTGYVREWNGLETVIDLLALPGSEQLVLLVVGDGPARGALEKRAADRGVSDRVRFTGRVARDDIAGWVSAFDVALQPAANPYASPLKLFEYMALQRAIVAPDQPNIREVLRHDDNALLFRPGDDAQFGEAVRRLALDETLRLRLGQRAAETVRQRRLTWSHNARRVTELAQRLVIEAGGVAADVGLRTDTAVADWSTERIRTLRPDSRGPSLPEAREPATHERADSRGA